jgi:hypothetical protein
LHQLPSNGRLSSHGSSISAPDYSAPTIPTPIDHYNSSDIQNFSNRYWVNSTYYRPGGPVFYFDSGEQNAHPLCAVLPNRGRWTFSGDVPCAEI